MYSGSITSSPHHHHPHDVIDGKRTSKLVEDEYTNIEAPQERDSAIGSGMDDDDEVLIIVVFRSWYFLNALFGGCGR